MFFLFYILHTHTSTHIWSFLSILHYHTHLHPQLLNLSTLLHCSQSIFRNPTYLFLYLLDGLAGIQHMPAHWGMGLGIWGGLLEVLDGIKAAAHLGLEVDFLVALFAVLTSLYTNVYVLGDMIRAICMNVYVYVYVPLLSYICTSYWWHSSIHVLLLA